jgi:hypothetical protein
MYIHVLIFCASPQVVLKDLQTNSKITPIVPYLLNLLALGLQKLPRGVTYAHFRHRFLCIAEAMTCNSFIEPSAMISVRTVYTFVVPAVHHSMLAFTFLTRLVDLQKSLSFLM